MCLVLTQYYYIPISGSVGPTRACDWPCSYAVPISDRVDRMRACDWPSKYYIVYVIDPVLLFACDWPPVLSYSNGRMLLPLLVYHYNNGRYPSSLHLVCIALELVL